MKKTMPLPMQPTADMINAAYMLIETMSKGTDVRHKRIVTEVWKTMAACAPEAKTGGLTPRMSIALEIIAEFIADNNRSPNLREIAEQMGRKKTTAYQIVHALRRRGFITFPGGKHEAIRILIHPGQTKG